MTEKHVSFLLRRYVCGRNRRGFLTSGCSGKKNLIPSVRSGGERLQPKVRDHFERGGTLHRKRTYDGGRAYKM